MPRGSRERRRLRLGCLAQSTPSRQPDGEDLLNIAHTQARSLLDSYRCMIQISMCILSGTAADAVFQIAHCVAT